MSESADKILRVRAYLKQHKLDGVVFSTRANFAWLSGGGDNHVVSQTDGGVGALVVTAKQALVVANRIEIDRLKSEESLSAFTAKSFPWIDSMQAALAELLPKGKYASDDVSNGMAGLPGDFVQEVRAQLAEAEIRRYKGLGRDCALVIETVARNLQVGDSEHQAEADLARHLLARGIQPYVVLVAYDERILKHRHPTPSAKHLRKHAMLVVCGQRHGLIANITRFVHFGAVAPDLLKKHEAVCRVEAAFWEATVTGRTWGEAFAAGQAQYKKEGVAKEWELHHQGGSSGYAGRDIIATPGEKRKILDNIAVAWNPSITGTKTEDTYLLQNGVRTVITAASDHWPTVSVKAPSGETFVRPAILVR